jgi:hypothetical protein
MRQRACGAQSRLEPGLLPWAVSAGRTLPQAGALGTALLLQPLSVCSPYSQLPEWVMAGGADAWGWVSAEEGQLQGRHP